MPWVPSSRRRLQVTQRLCDTSAKVRTTGELRANVIRSRTILLFVLATIPVVHSQIGGDPAGYPSDARSPFPGRGSGGQKQAGRPTASSEIPVTFTGKLAKLDNKTIVVDLSDSRTLEFRRTNHTKFYKNAKKVDATEFKTGDEVFVEALEDQLGWLTAIAVTWQSASQSRVQTPATSLASVVAPPANDSEDPGPPLLKRGRPPNRATPKAARESQPAAEVRQIQEDAVDSYLEKTRAVSESFLEKLPNYLCTQYVTRYGSASRPVDWKAIDIVSANVAYENGKERYSSVSVNGRPIYKAMEEVGGSWSTGEFGTMLQDVLSPATAAKFHYSRNSLIRGKTVRVYDFEVLSENSHWRVGVGSQSIYPAYRGALWIDPTSGYVLRIEMQAQRLPQGFPSELVESAVDFDTVQLGGKQFLLPVHAENLSCQRASLSCVRNAIDFRNYHLYEAESNITFDTPKQ